MHWVSFSTVFVALQFALIGWLVWKFWLSNDDESQFAVRESDLPRRPSKQRAGRPKQALPGFNFSGAPHEILGVPPTASPRQIQKAYKNLMKRYHPDRMDRDDSEQLEFAKRASIAINHAREAMLKQFK